MHQICVVDDHIHASEALLRCGDDGVDEGDVGKIAHAFAYRNALFPQAVRKRLQGLCLAPCDHEVHSVSGEPVAQRLADAACSAGYDGGLADQVRISVFHGFPSC